MVDQPDAVLRAAEEVSGLVHGRRVDGEDDRAAVPRADPPRGLGVGREVHAMARHAEQALPRDAVRGAVARAVVEDGGGFDRLKLQVDVHAVALVGADQGAGRVQREAIFIVPRHDLITASSARAASRCGTDPIACLPDNPLSPGLRS